MYEPLGVQLKQLRELRGLSQEKAAKAAGISQAHLSLIEAGKRSVSIPVLENLLHILDAVVLLLPIEEVRDTSS